MEVKVARKILEANDSIARQNRRYFEAHAVFVLNMMSSPGSGKTTLLQKSLSKLMPDLRCAVLVGDICTANDADRLAASGAPVVQINTDEFGGECHLGAYIIEKYARDLDLDTIDLLIVENIGNLVCPAEFDIGEDLRVVVLSVTEGEDKPVKYPLMFRECNAALINKIDLLPYLDYEMSATQTYLRQVNPDLSVFQLSAKTNEGLTPWLEWLKSCVKQKIHLAS